MSSLKKVRLCVVLIIFVVLVLTFLKPYLIREVESGAPAERFTGYLDQRIPELMESHRIPGVNIALVKEGKTLWTQAYGYAQVEAGRKMTTDTYLRVESISKSVTSWGVMKLVEQGIIQLDAPVVSYLKNWKFPESRFSEEKVTVRQLLSHSAGLPLGNIFNRYAPTKEIPSLQDSLSMQAVLVRAPGTSFSYSNTGFNLLELLIEEVTGRNFAEYMEQEILNPLGMVKSSFTWSADFNPEVPNGYDLTGKPVPVYIYPEKGSGGLFATVEDIARFLTAGMPGFTQDHPVINTESINALYSPTIKRLGIYSLVFDAYGLGYYIERLGGRRAVSHGGQGAGWMTHFHAVPETGDGIVILTNSQRSWPFIAYILRDWAKWNGFSSVGMGKIIIGQHILTILVGLIWITILWWGWRLGKELISGKRRFAPLAKESRSLRLMQSSFSLILLSILWWCLNQDYLFISSVFPLVAGWLGISTFFFALVLLLSSLLVHKEERRCF